ncbi:MAG: hypothetical protein WAU96_12480 [Anaerolineae bacterium]|nr:hypothetical protein [Thermoflexales bacterium]
MPEKNQLEKTTFVKLYSKSMSVCDLSRQKPGSLPGVISESSTVFAGFEAFYCAETMILLITRSASNTAYWKLDWLPQRRIETVGGLDVTGAVDEIYERSRAWKDDVERIVFANAPSWIIPPPKNEKEESASPGDVLKEVADQVNAGALGPNVTATVTPSPRNKKTR